MDKTHAQRAYDHLRYKFVTGEFIPGTRIRYGPVGKELGISATPVREAIGKLANEGFVELVPQLGAVVRRISREELIELYEMREALEPYAAARAAERIDQTLYAEIEIQFKQMLQLTNQVTKTKTKTVTNKIIKQFEKADLAFHMLIIEATGNQTMVRTLGNSHVLAKIFSMDRHRYDVSVMKDTCDDHRRISNALKRRKPEMARDAMAIHIRNGLELTLSTDSDGPERWWENQ